MVDIKDQEMLASMKGGMKTRRPVDFSLFRTSRRMRDVHRLSGFHYSRPYSDAEHCFYTALLFKELADAEGIAISSCDLQWVMLHDVLETLTGDLLYPAKNGSKETREAWDMIEEDVANKNKEVSRFTDERGRQELGEEKWELFKVCDALELWLFCVEEEEYTGRVLKNPDGSSVRSKMAEIIERSRFEYVILALGGANE